jgi:hypothetical protein
LVSTTQWIAALQALWATLGELHQECIADAFTAAEPRIER